MPPCRPAVRGEEIDPDRFGWSVSDSFQGNFGPRHPVRCSETSNMGDRITIDSATLMNKGFEVIEARWLFDFPPEAIEVVVHPQSSVHAMVEYEDGSVIAQVSA